MRFSLPAVLLLILGCAAPPPPGPRELPPSKIRDGRNASGGVLIPEQAAFDVRHCRLELKVDPEKEEIHGSLTMTVRAVEKLGYLVLDLDDRLKVSKVEGDAAPLAFRHEGGLIQITLDRWVARGRDVTVAVHYGGKPRVAPQPPWKGGFTWAKTPSGAHWIATSCQGAGADLWWPCKDHPSDKTESMDLVITVPKGLVCATNGKLKAQKEGPDTTTFHWRLDTPVSNYCIALNIAPYEVITQELKSVTGEKVPLLFYVLPEHRKQGEKALPGFLKDFHFFEKVLGPYPFRAEKYGIAETPFLGMEHATITAYGNRFRAGADGYDWLHNHEFAHEWFANLVTCRDWKDMWIHEGIGTYMQALYLEHAHGPRAYRREMGRYLGGLNNSRAVAPRETKDSKQIYFSPSGAHDNDIYYKGAGIMHTLRWVLGDEKFFLALRRMAYPDPAMERKTDGTQIRFSDTEEIRSIAEKVGGHRLQWFFEVYLRQPKLPELVEETKDGELHLRWKVPGDLSFPMPVPVRIGDELKRIEMKDGSATVPLPEDGRYTIDPDRWLLKN